MTTLDPVSSSTGSSAQSGRPMRRHGARRSIVALLIVSLVSSGLLREAATSYQAHIAGERGLVSSRGALGNMNSFALALLLGGLRGPLVMFLWSTSEAQKTDRDLEDLDTKIEWIRLLQPEFDTVHLFQIWNKAYNISAMMASPANKYMIITEAIDYGYKVDQERPGDLNILEALGGTYAGKLAATNLPEEQFYQRQFREESLIDANRITAFPEDVKTFQHLSAMKPLLDASNRIRIDLVTGIRSRPAKPTPNDQWNDGSALQYLKRYEPFPWGISPHAMAFNYTKRAQVAMRSEGQQPLQLSAMVIDSQPAILQKGWAEEESERASTFMARAFNIPITNDIKKNTTALAQIRLDQAVSSKADTDGALYCYDMVVRLCEDASTEYQQHLANANYAERIALYQSHLDDLSSLKKLSNADRDYLQAILAAKDYRAKLIQSALAGYQQALILIERNVLSHYTEGAVLADSTFPRAFDSRFKIRDMPDDAVPMTYEKSLQIMKDREYTSYTDEHRDYARLIERCVTRLAELKRVLDMPSSGSPAK